MSSPGAIGPFDSNSPQGTTQDSPSFMDEAIHKNFTYIYAVLITVLVLLILAFFGILYLYIRRRRRRAQARLLQAAEDADASSSDPQRHKKHKHRGKKPKLASAWIGNGPLPITLSTEALLEVIQPFSLAKANEKTLLNDIEKSSMAFSSPSTASLPIKDEKASSTIDLHTPKRPQIHDVQLLNAGFLIAMPMPRPTSSLRLRGSPSSLSLSHSSSEGSCESDEVSIAESRWTDHLCHGELPELTLGISTISVLSSSTTTLSS